jgi:hypothetical protein
MNAYALVETIESPPEPDLEMLEDDVVDPAALARWEDDGGAVSGGSDLVRRFVSSIY